MAPMYDPDSGTTSDVAYGLDTHAQVAGDESLFTNVKNLVTKGVPLTGLSVVNSFANTGIELSNWLTGSQFKKVSVEDEVGDGTLNDYYNKHSQGIELAGLAAGSLIPGTLAVKALKLAQAGRMTETLAAATNIFAGPKARIVDEAAQEIAGGGQAGLFGTLTAQKTKAIALGFGDQALQALAFQAGTLATMKASPLLDQQGLSDIVSNTFYGTLIGGGIGGLIEGIGTVANINKISAKFDFATKQAELIDYLGKGNYIAGDKAVSILNAMYSIPDESTGLLGAKAAQTLDNAKLQFKKQLTALAPNGDNRYTNSLADMLIKAKQSGSLTREDAYMHLARLDKLSSITDIPVDTADSSEGLFYVNNFAKGMTKQLSDLITDVPSSRAAASLAYQLSPDAADLSVAHALEKTELPDGTQFNTYSKISDAWDAGHDFFIDKNLKVHVNPDSENIVGRVAKPGESRPLTVAEEIERTATGQLPAGSKPLRTAPVIMNTQTGAMTTEAIPSLGDHGIVASSKEGVQYGDSFSKQTIDTPYSANMSTNDAQARFVWAADRGIKTGDSIVANDVPLLDQLYKQMTGGKGFDYNGWNKQLSAKEVSIQGMDALPSTPEKLLDYIRTQKDQVIHDTLLSDKSNIDEVAYKAGVPRQYIENNFTASSPEEILSTPEQYKQVNHVALQYNIGNIYKNDGMILQGQLDTQYRIGLIKDANVAQAAKHFGANYEQFLATDYTSADAGILGAGHKFLRFSNAGYNTLAQRMESIGATLAQWLPGKVSKELSGLQSSANALRADSTIAAKANLFEAVKQRTGELYRLLPAELEQKYLLKPGEAATGNVAVLKSSLKFDKVGNVIDWDKARVPDGFFPGLAVADRAGLAAENSQALHTFYQLDPAVADWNRANQAINDRNIQARNGFRQAVGLPVKVQTGDLYPAPIDTSKFSHFAFLKAKPGSAMADDGVAVITAKSAEDLQARIVAMQDRYSVYTKEMLKQHHEIEGDYLYNRNFAQSRVNSDLARQGVLNDVLPGTRADDLIQHYADYHTRQISLLARDHVELGNAQLFEELRQMGSRFTQTATSQTGLVSKVLSKEANNPYDDYLRTALNLSAKDKYPLWQTATEKVEAFADSAFKVARSAFSAARQGVISYEDAANMAQSLGLGNPYGAGIDAIKNYYEIANQLPEPRILQKFVSAANAVMGASVIRLDFFQQAIHWMSTPVLMSAEAQSAISQAKDFITTTLPDGTGRTIPSVTKAMMNSLIKLNSDEVRNTWLPLYKQMGIVRERSSEFGIDSYYKLIDNLRLPLGKISEKGIDKRISDLVDVGAKITGSNFSEKMLHLWSAETARSIFGEGGAGQTGQKLMDNIRTFVNRVEGNYIASQRPVAFQGPIGSAMALFQTYQFNLLQQAFRYVGNGETKAIAALAGLQTTFFGLQGLPGFQLINNRIVGNASGNPDHTDVYSSANDVLGHKLANYVLYGVASNWMNAGLYTRGDINPRRISVLPIDPMDYSAISGGIKLVSNIYNMSQKIAQGGSIPASLLMALEHNGLNRPLQGLAQLAQGFVTNASGQLIAKTGTQDVDGTMGGNELFSLGNFSRLLGARPLDEAVALDASFRSSVYQAKDLARIQALGSAVKSTLIGGNSPSPDQVSDFAAKYAASGGQIQNFGKAMMNWAQQTKVSVANKVFRQLGTDRNKNLMIQMGGIPLPDYTNTDSESTGTGQ